MNKLCFNGFLLKSKAHGESNKTISIFTEESGKIMLYARGVRKPASKIGGRLHPLFLNTYHILERQNFRLITGVDTIDEYLCIANDLNKLSIMYELLWIIEHGTTHEQPHPDLFHLLKNSLRTLSKSTQECHTILPYFQTQYMEIEGLRGSEKATQPFNQLFYNYTGTLYQPSTLKFHD